MKKLFTLFIALTAVISLYAENYFLKSTWGEAEATWKQMIDDDGSFIFAGDVFFDGNDIAINTVASDEGARIIKVENINSMLNYEPAPIAAGDSVFFVYDPESYSSVDPTQSGLSAMINFKKGAAIKVKGEWKEMLADDATFVLYNEFFDGNDVAFATGKNIRSIKVANINSMLNFEPAPLAAGDSVLFAYDPEEYSAYDETKSGLSAMINFKKGAAIKVKGEWKEMLADDATFVLYNEFFDGNDVAFATGKNIRSIKPENIQTLLNYEAAELAKGDSVLFVYNPEEYASMDPSKSGLIAMINWKAGYAILENGAWKDMTEDDGTFSTYTNVAVDGKNVQLAHEKQIRAIAVENIQALLNYDAAELAEGDSVMYVYDPEGYSQYDETKSGLIAMINWKAGYAILENGAWKDMTEDDGTFSTYTNVAVDGKNVQLAHEKQIRAIKMENIQALLNYDAAELAEGDSVMYVFDPEGYSQYDETKSGLIAMINWKAGYAIHIGKEWKNLIDDDPEEHDWWIFEKTVFDGKNIQIANENQIRSIEPKNVTAYINYDDAELSAGDSVMYVYRPSLYNRYDEKESGMYAHILYKNGYAMRGTWGEQFPSWKNMTLDAEQEDETYVLDSVIFDGNDVQFASTEGIRVIKVENIPALLLDDYSEAVLEAGDLVMFVYTPDTYSHYEEAKSGLMALIIEKNEVTAVDNIGADVKATKVMMNGQIFIIKNGKTYNVNGVLVK